MIVFVCLLFRKRLQWEYLRFSLFCLGCYAVLTRVSSLSLIRGVGWENELEGVPVRRANVVGAKV